MVARAKWQAWTEVRGMRALATPMLHPPRSCRVPTALARVQLGCASRTVQLAGTSNQDAEARYIARVASLTGADTSTGSAGADGAPQSITTSLQ